MLNTAIKAARRAGSIINRYVDALDRLTIEEKGRNDYVTEIDRLAEAEIIDIIRNAYPHHAIIAEESGHHSGERYEWIIDPLDGTTNFVHGFPHLAVSICVRANDKLDQAVIFDPIKNELFTSSRGRGAFLNDRRIRVSRTTRMQHALLATGFPVREDIQHLDMWLATVRSVLTHSSGVRRAGSAALDLAYVANGRVDGYWETGINIWDMAAGCLLIEEAGGLVGDFTGGNRYLERGDVVTGNTPIYRELLRLIEPHLTDDLR